MEDEYPTETDEQKRQVPYIEKGLGAQKFKTGDLESAIKHYSKSLLAVKYLTDNDSLIKITIEEMAEYAQNIIIPCNNNLAFCYLKNKDYQNSIHFATKVLEMDPKNTKGYYRRGLAYLHNGDLDLAENEFKRILELEPNEEAKKQLVVINQKRKEDEDKVRAGMKKMFDE